MAPLRDLLVVVPHSGLAVPAELSLESLSERLNELARNVDWHTDALYDFRDLLDNRHLAFPYLSLLLEANRHPELLDDCVPLKDVFGEPVYRPGCEPAEGLRRLLVQKYLVAFHKEIEAAILTGAEFLLDGHSAVEGKGIAANQIELMNYQSSWLDPEPKRFSPNAYVETYAEELQRRLPEVRVTINASDYASVYGHVCAEHSVDAFARTGRRVPAVLQETCERLYREPGKAPDVYALNRLRRVFAESLQATIQRVRSLGVIEKVIPLHSLRQTFDFDCGAKALQVLLAYYGVELREDQLLAELEADKKDGVLPESMVAVARSHGFEVGSGLDWTLEDIKRPVSEGHPVIVLLQAWADRHLSLEDWAANYDDGHYAIVTGYDKDVLLFEDPASFHRTWLEADEFLARWHDRHPRTGERLKHWALVLRGRSPVERVMEHMK
ncbi:MAG TPA: N-formylglutamate amidohydrolase [Myxococcales bacterium]|jgi:predicted double-glycine peptidase